MKKKATFLLIFAACLLLVIFAAYLSYSHNLVKYTQETAKMRLQEIVAPNIRSFNLQMGEQVKKVQTMADYFGQVGELGGTEHQVLLHTATEVNGLLRCALAFPDGSFITNDNKNEGNVSQIPFFIHSMRGELFITDPMPAVVDPSKIVILFAYPIYRNNEVAGSLIYSYLCNDMDQIFNLDFLDGQGQILVTNQAGDALIGDSTFIPNRGNLVNYLRENCTHKQHTPETCLQIIGTKGSCSITLLNQADPLLVHYDKLAYNDWYMLSMAPTSATTSSILAVALAQRNLGLCITVCILIYLITILVLWVSQRKSIDKMTGALTLDGFKRISKRIIRQHPDECFIFVKLDIKNFKLINRIYDFAVGDRAIKSMAEALRVILAPLCSAYARIGTDDFVLMLPFTERANLDEQRTAFILKFRELMGEDFTTTVEFPTGQYVTTLADAKHPDITEFLEKANFAHRAAKLNNWDMIVDYAENLESKAIFQKAIEDKMALALTNEEFQLYLQPKYCVKDETICGAEALVRWSIGGVIYMHPIDFVPVLERNGFIVKLDKYMFECAVQKIHSVLAAGAIPVPISVNLSRYHLTNERLVEELCAIADRYNVPHKYLELELTESVMCDNVAQIIQLLTELHAAEFTLAMDDFGIGYSSLGLLKDLEVDVIKIDKCFFDLNSNWDRARIVIANILRLAQELHIETVAEGVEDLEQVKLLRELGCDIIQGYYYSRPIPANQVDLRRAASAEQPNSQPPIPIA